MQEMLETGFVGEDSLRRKWHPLQHCRGTPMARGAWWATVMGSQRVRHDGASQHQHTEDKVGTFFFYGMILYQQCFSLVLVKIRLSNVHQLNVFIHCINIGLLSTSYVPGPDGVDLASFGGK